MEKLILKVYYKEVPENLDFLDEMLFDCKLYFNSDYNNSYGCLSKGDDSYKCMPCNCPIGCQASLADIKRYDEGRYEDYKGDMPEDENEDDYCPEDCEDHPMIREKEVIKIEADFRNIILAIKPDTFDKMEQYEIDNLNDEKYLELLKEILGDKDYDEVNEYGIELEWIEESEVEERNNTDSMTNSISEQ